jgi:predicted phosphodiesterase
MAVSKERALEIYDYCMKHGTDKTCEYFGLAESTVKTRVIEGRRYKRELCIEDPDKEIIEHNVILAKQKQKAQDKNRIANKSFREYARVENALTEYSKEILNVLKTNNELFKNFTKLHEYDSTKVNQAGIITLADWHFNELIDLSFNKYNFTIASKRLKKLAEKAIKRFESENIKEIFVVGLGDFVNSDRRLDELLSQATNRSKATVLTTYLIGKFLYHLNQHFNLDVVSVMGNESRLKQEMSFSDSAISDNYDFVIFGMLREMCRNTPGIKFGSIDTYHTVIKISNFNFLCMHGYGNTAQIEKYTIQTIGRYANQGIKIDYVFYGDKHSSRIGDYFARSGSGCGGNSYSENHLNLSSRASQNIFIVNENDIDGMRIDLQNTDGYQGYDFPSELESYYAKSEGKTKQKTKIMEIII